jgi:hypothetical protein
LKVRHDYKNYVKAFKYKLSYYCCEEAEGIENAREDILFVREAD